MNKKNTWYYKNTATKEITTDREIKNNWVNSGIDVEFIRFSIVGNGFRTFIVEEGKKQG